MNKDTSTGPLTTKPNDHMRCITKGLSEDGLFLVDDHRTDQICDQILEAANDSKIEVTNDKMKRIVEMLRAYKKH